MKTQLLIGAVTLLATSLLAADAKDELKTAAKKLGDAGGYCWKATTELAGGGGGGGGGGAMRPGPTEGKIAKDGTICLSMTRGDNTTEAFVKDGKGAIKTQDGWQSLADATAAAGGGGGGGQGNRGRFIARTLQNYKAPASDIADMADKAKELKKEGDMVCGDLTEDGAKSLMSFGRGQGGNGPEISGAKGSVKVWLKDGMPVKYEYKVSGKMSFNGNERDIDRTTTVEIKDVGGAKFDVPDDAKKKMS